MRRTLVLLGLCAAGVLAVLVIEPPVRRTGEQLARGPRVFRTSAGGIRRIEVTIRDRVLVAERARDGWRVAGVPAPPETRDALHELATYLAGLRAVDAFRTTNLEAFGLDPPAGMVVLATSRGPQRLALGSLNAVGSTLYARRGDEQRVLQIGVYLVSALDRLLRQPAETDGGATTVRRSDTPARPRSVRSGRDRAAPRRGGASRVGPPSG